MPTPEKTRGILGANTACDGKRDRKRHDKTEAHSVLHLAKFKQVSARSCWSRSTMARIELSFPRTLSVQGGGAGSVCAALRRPLRYLRTGTLPRTGYTSHVNSKNVDRTITYLRLGS